MACELCHFYNYKYDEVLEFDCEVFNILYDGMQQIIARNTLNDFTKSDWSHMKTSERHKLHRKIYKIAYPVALKESAVTTDKLKTLGVITPEIAKNGR